jgi:hypothetical protein
MRQVNGHNTPSPRCVGGRNRATVQLDDPFRDRQAQAEARPTSAVGLDPVEPSDPPPGEDSVQPTYLVSALQNLFA